MTELHAELHGGHNGMELTECPEPVCASSWVRPLTTMVKAL
ncbi:MAG: hypothetical protein FD174_1708 [Geobacteraceae bacterium]|nr:MAG: hypothetical protein FD174_1708 [Geobacteraceae bacterium]